MYRTGSECCGAYAERSELRDLVAFRMRGCLVQILAVGSIVPHDMYLFATYVNSGSQLLSCNLRHCQLPSLTVFFNKARVRAVEDRKRLSRGDVARSRCISLLSS